MKKLLGILFSSALISGCVCNMPMTKPVEQVKAPEPAVSPAPAAGPDKLVLFDFENDAEMKNFFTKNGPGNVTMDFPCERVAENATSGKYSLKVSYPPNGSWPGVHFVNFPKDWSKYNSCVVDMYNPLKHPVSFHTATIDEDAGVTPDNPFGTYGLRFHGYYTVKPGKSTFVHDLNGILVEDGSRQPKFDKIKMVVFMVINRTNDEVLYFDNIRLENRDE